MIDVVFTGQIKYATNSKKEVESYLAFYACSPIHLDAARLIDTKEFIMNLKRFIARGGRPRLIYSDNLKAAVKLVPFVRQDDNLSSLFD